MNSGNLGKVAQNFFLKVQAILVAGAKQDKQKRILPKHIVKLGSNKNEILF